MVDNVNPTSQFHPYQPQNATPQTGGGSTQRTGVSRILSKVGIGQSKIDAIGSRMGHVNLRGQVSKVRTFARDNSGMVLGGLAALAIGAGLMRRRSMMASTR